MSYSMLEPESEPVCECRYDEVRDRIDRDDCSVHWELREEASRAEPLSKKQTVRRKPAAIQKRHEGDAA